MRPLEKARGACLDLKMIWGRAHAHAVAGNVTKQSPPATGTISEGRGWVGGGGGGGRVGGGRAEGSLRATFFVWIRLLNAGLGQLKRRCRLE
jgi:hypothetical protein